MHFSFCIILTKVYTLHPHKESKERLANKLTTMLLYFLFRFYMRQIAQDYKTLYSHVMFVQTELLLPQIVHPEFSHGYWNSFIVYRQVT